jgi:hypothetical protein
VIIFLVNLSEYFFKYSANGEISRVKHPKLSKQRKRKKKLKIEGMPKRNPPAYILFYRATKDEFKKNNPGLSH